MLPPTVPPSLIFYKTPLRTSPAPSPDPVAHHIAPSYSSRAPPPHTAAARHPPSSPGPGQASGLHLRPPFRAAGGLPAASASTPTSTPPPHPTSRGSSPSPTTEATPARHPRSFIVDSKLPKWRPLLPPRKPPPAPTRPLASASSRPAPAQLPGLHCRPASACPLPGPSSPTSAAARAQGAVEAAARTELTRLPRSLPPSSLRSPHGGRCGSSSAQDGETPAAAAAVSAAASQSVLLRDRTNPGQGTYPRRK